MQTYTAPGTGHELLSIEAPLLNGQMYSTKLTRNRSALASTISALASGRSRQVMALLMNSLSIML